ncbi:MAG: hypothetical protein NTAFB01_05500 [Nitrospira sp.]
MPDRGPVALQAEQVRLLSDAYRLAAYDRRGIFDAIIKQQECNMRFWTTYRADKASTVPTPPETIQQRIEWTERERDYTQINRAMFERVLT